MNEEKFKKLKIVLDRFVHILHELYGFYLDTNRGFQLYYQEASSYPPQQYVIFSNSSPDDPAAVILNESTGHDICQRNRKDGPNSERTRGHVLIMISEYWNGDIRSEIAQAIELENANDVTSQIMGDLNKIRNDLLHSRGKADRSASGIIINFKKGDQIKITSEIFDKVFVEIFEYFNKLSFEHTALMMYHDRSLHQQSKKIHSSMKHTIIHPA